MKKLLLLTTVLFALSTPALADDAGICTRTDPAPTPNDEILVATCTRAIERSRTGPSCTLGAEWRSTI